MLRRLDLKNPAAVGISGMVVIQTVGIAPKSDHPCLHNREESAHRKGLHHRDLDALRILVLKIGTR